MSTEIQVKSPEPYSPEWEAIANNTARALVPNIYPCDKCNYPVISGYCCTNCGDANPSDPE